MRQWRSRQNLERNASPTHYHYHYHYHYPVSHSWEAQNPETSHTNETYHPQFSPNKARFPEQLSFCSEQNEWKRYLNPKVSRMYEEYQLQQSRFSQNNDRIDKLLEPSEVVVPVRSAVLDGSRERPGGGPQKRQLKKLEQLYSLQRRLKGSLQQKNRSQITMLTSSENIDVQDRLTTLQKQIERLRSIEEECIYLRDKFYLHIVRRHPGQ